MYRVPPPAATATSAIHPTGPPPDAAPTVSAPTSSEEAALLLEFTTSQKDALGAVVERGQPSVGGKTMASRPRRLSCWSGTLSSRASSLATSQLTRPP